MIISKNDLQILDLTIWRLCIKIYMTLAFYPVKTETVFPMDTGAICLLLLNTQFLQLGDKVMKIKLLTQP